MATAERTIRQMREGEIFSAVSADMVEGPEPTRPVNLDDIEMDMYEREVAVQPRLGMSPEIERLDLMDLS